jgi:hypothetical protein
MVREGEFKVKFLREGQVERAFPKESGKGGFWIERIPVGTVKRLSRRSVDFWRGRDATMLEILTIDEQAPPLTSPTSTVVDPVWEDERKAELRRAIDAALTGAADISAVLMLNPETLPGVDQADIERLADPFAAPAALKAIRALVRGRPGRRPKHAP